VLEVAAARGLGSESGRYLYLSRLCRERFTFVCLFVNPIRVEEEDDGDMIMNMY